MSPALQKLCGVVVTVLTALIAANAYPSLNGIFAGVIGLASWLGMDRPGAKGAAQSQLMQQLASLPPSQIVKTVQNSANPQDPKKPSTVLLVLLVLLAGCSGITAPQATSTGRQVISALASIEKDPDAVRRLAAADYALAAVSQALGKQDLVLLQAAAPCAVKALREVRPDAASQPALRDSLELAIQALEAIGGECLVQEDDSDGGVSLRENATPMNAWRSVSGYMAHRFVSEMRAAGVSASLCKDPDRCAVPV